METNIIDRLTYFGEKLIPEYESKFGVSLEGAIFFEPSGVLDYPETVEEAIKRLEDAIDAGIPINEDDIQWFNPDVVY